ncbi:MAG TPA: hypothetical protein VFS33_04985 [Gemmatimonadales bacterium]|nr:hypothetical protein [Gemmatimonadales bacterium]
MYRIELGPDDIGVFRSIEEIAQGIRSGVINSRCRIYHQASDKWLPIEFHPHYKRALELASGAPATAAPPAPPPAPVLPGANGPVLTATAAAGVALADEEDEGEREESTPAADSAPAAADAVPASEMAAPQPVARMPRLRVELAQVRPRRLAVLTLSGALLAGVAQIGLGTMPAPWDLEMGIHLPTLSVPAIKLPALTLPRPRAPSLGTLASPAPAAAAPAGSPPAAPAPGPAGAAAAAARPAPVDAHDTPSFGGNASTVAMPRHPASPSLAHASAAEADADSALPLVPAPSASDIVTGAALGATPPKEAMSPAALVARYQGAYAAARAELQTGLRAAGFADLFAASRLQSGDGVRAARRSLTAATAYVARYHRRERAIEAAYGDSVMTLARQLGWSEEQLKPWNQRKSLEETPEVAKLTDFLLQSLDSLYNVLLAEEGAYQLHANAISFQNPMAARAYAELRPWLNPKAHAWADSAAAGASSTAAQVLRAMGPGLLPDGGGI